MKILIAVDGSEHTDRMLACLGAQPEWLDRRHEYTVLTVEPALPPHAAASLGKDVCQSYYEDEARKAFEPVRRFFGDKQIDATYVAKVGPAAPAIASLADHDGFAVLMMGSHGHGTFVGMVLGSVVTKVLALCRTPVLLLR